MKFNRSYLVISLSLLLVLFISCKKFLDQQPISELSPDMVFKDVESTKRALAGVYSRLIGDQGYGIRLSLYFSVDNDETQGPTGSSDNDRRDLARYNANPGNAQITKPFQQIFQGIEFANVCIENIPEMDMYKNGNAQQKAQLQRMYGEALTLRAQFYFEAIRNWGDLPEHFISASKLATSNPFPQKVDKDILYDRLLSDLALAKTLVPWRNELASIGDISDERITKGVVKGLRARIALFRGGYSVRSNGNVERGSNYLAYYQIAKTECEEIMNSGQHNLNPSYKALWKGQVCAHAVNDPDGELMFQVSAFGGTGVADSKLGYYNGPTVTVGSSSYGNKSINILPTYFYLFDSTDLRRDVTCVPYNIESDGITKKGAAITGINDGKFRRDWISAPSILPNNAIQYFGLKWQILRYSDVMLMYAEAENEINGASLSAYDALNKVRRRGYGKPISVPDPSVDLVSGLSKTDFFKAVVRERSLELGGEGIRKYDLIRWNLLLIAVSKTSENLQRMSNLYELNPPDYMAGYPSYCVSSTLPTNMYYITGTTADDSRMWANSLYYGSPSSTPTGTSRVTWLGSAISTNSLSRYAIGVRADQNPSGTPIELKQLLPIPQPAIDANYNLKQNPGY